MADLNVPDNTLSGRKEETKILRKLLQKGTSELVAAIGRRRVGKTFLIKKVFEKEMIFTMTGTQGASKTEQLSNFTDALQNAYGARPVLTTPANWLKAFDLLKKFINKKRTSRKKVLFFDELPWIASPRSGFLQSFDHFWNSWAVNQNIIVVICGSAATWMINNIINNTGGLHNRVTKRLHISPFTLAQTEQYFRDRKINLPRYDILNVYMALGGIPFYLREVERGDTAIQAIDRICFGKKAALRGEFDNLYKALFNNHELHIVVIKVLSKKRKGLTRKEIIKNTSLPSGGSFSTILRELEESDFISSYVPYGKKERDTLYRLTDSYSLFYLKHLEHNNDTKGTWLKKALTPSVRSWSGYAFESICFMHIHSVKKALGIEGILTQESGYVKQGNDEIKGFQIDMLIDRADNAINICEAKYYNAEYLLTAREAQKIRERKSLFQATTKNRKQIVTTLITTYGLLTNKHSASIDKVLTMDDLFLI